MNYEDELKKEIEENKDIFETLDKEAQKRLIKDFERDITRERLFIIKIAEAKIEGYQKAKEDFKEMIDELFKKLKEEHKEWRKEGVAGEYFTNSFEFKIDKFQEEIKNKLEGKK